MASSTENAANDMTTDETTKKADSRAGLREKHKAVDDTKKGMEDPENDDVLAADSAIDIDVMTKNQLIERLRQLRLPVSGLKATLRERLRAATQEDNSDEDDSNEDDSEDDKEDGEDTVLYCDDNERETSTVDHSDRRHDRESLSTTRRGTTPPPRHNRVHYEEREPNPYSVRTGQPVLTYKDVEDALTPFSGDGTQNVGRWFTSFEETADLCRWTDVQKIIYAKRLLRGSAKLFVNFECRIQSYGALKKALIKEFGKTMNSRQVHKELSAVSKKMDETHQEYVYRVLELASHTEMELEAKIQYIIDGVKDEEVNKSILYGATTIKELRQRFAQYEIQKSNRGKTRQQPQAQGKKKPVSNAGQTTAAAAGKRCFNCGDTKHLGKECPNKTKGAKCYSCGEFGHIAAKCPKGSDSASKDATPVRVDVLRSHSDKKTYKKVNILGKDVTAVIDPGSDLHLMRSSVYVHLGAPSIRHEITKFNGVGAFNRSTLGRFTADVSIDEIWFTLDIDIVPDDYTGHDLIIGGELSDLAEIRIRRRQAVVKKLSDDESKTTTKDANWAEVLCIDVQDDGEKESKAQVTLDHVKDPNIRERVRKLVEDYQPRKIKDSGVKMRLILKDEVPVYQNPRRLSAEQRNTVRKIIDEWIEKGIVRPSNSEYASPIVLVKKKDGSIRLCVDYRKINRKIMRDRQPLPLIEDELDELTEAEVYCVLDLKDGFFHVPLDEDSIRYTAFVTPDGQFEYLMAPFGLCNSPAAFQRLMRAVFKMVKTYLDDVIIAAKNEEECLTKLEQVLNTARDYGLRINWKKCKLLVRRVEYLGHIVEAGTVKPSPKKIEAVMRFEKPTKRDKVQSFLGLTGYFRKFIPQYALIARPLSQLLRKGVKFTFAAEQEQAFEQLKIALTNDPVLKLYKVGAETELHTDASKHGLGAILLQKDAEDNQLHPVYYASWKTVGAEERYSSYELEVLAVIRALRKFRVYLLNIPFRIITDCRAFVQTMSKKDVCLRVAHWALQLEEFDYEVKHRSGTAMRHVDALSRNPVECLTIRRMQNALMAQIKQAQADDPELREKIESMKADEDKGFVMLNGVLYKQDGGELLLVVPKVMQKEVILQAHERGHFGWRNTEHLLQHEYWFPLMRSKIQQVIGNCIRCLLAEKKRGKAEGLLQPLPKEDRPLDTYHIDHLGPIPSTKKSYAHIFVVVDAFTKFIWLYPTRSVTTDEVITRLRKQATIFGNPRRIVSDRGTAFTSHAFKQYCEEENIEHNLITTGVPRANGQVERLNQSIIAILTKLSLANPEEWYKYVDRVQQFINSSFNRSIGTSPFELLIGRNMQLKEDIQLREILQKLTIETFQQERSEIRNEAKENILKIQKENRETYNKKRKSATKYRVGDVVAIRRTQLGPGLKVHPKFLGPYKIVTVLRSDRYIVEKLGEHEGPKRTSTSADNLKPWPNRGWDPDLDFPGRKDSDGDVDADTLSIEDDADFRMSECGIASDGAAPSLGWAETERVSG